MTNLQHISNFRLHQKKIILIFFIRRSLEIHRFSVHINTEPKMVCPRCGKKFKEKRALVSLSITLGSRYPDYPDTETPSHDSLKGQILSGQFGPRDTESGRNRLSGYRDPSVQ